MFHCLSIRKLGLFFDRWFKSWLAINIWTPSIHQNHFNWICQFALYSDLCYYTKQISGIARGQGQIMHQLDNIISHLRENLGERSHQTRRGQKSILFDVERIRVSLILTLAVGGLGIFLFKGYIRRNWFLSLLLVDRFSHCMNPFFIDFFLMNI